MPTIQLYDQLQQFTLFQGMSHGDLMRIVAQTKFGFVKLQPGKRLLKEGDHCDSICLLMSGSVNIETSADDHSYTVNEFLPAPAILQAERLFGINRRSASTITGTDGASLVTIDKKEVLTLADNYLVFRLNLLNIFATRAQKLTRRTWARCPKSLQERIARFIADRCLYPAGKKTINIYMERLAQELNDSRLDISRALNAMQAKGLITLSRGRITVPALEKLLN